MLLKMGIQSPTQIFLPDSILPSPRSFDSDITIVGGGIAGLTLACALKDSGLSIVVVEAQPQSVAVTKGQAYAISLLSSRIFAGIGVWGEMLPKIETFKQIRLSDADYAQVVHFQPEELSTENLGYVAEHHALLQPLQEYLQKCPNVTYFCPAQATNINYQADGVELELRVGGGNRMWRSRLLVAADGGRSPIRQAAGITTSGWQYWQSCIVATIKPEKPHQNIAYERFWPSGPFAILPLPENRCRIVWTSPHEEAKALLALNDEQFLNELQKRYGNQMGKLALEGSRYLFPVQLMQSDRYVLSRLALIGDAAHCCHPVGGQGLNMGIRDAAAIAEILQTAHQQGEDIGSLSVLKRYESWRQLENLTILGFTDFLDRIFSNHWLPIVAIRRLGLRILQTIQPVKIYALQLMTGLRGRSPQLGQINSGRS